MLQQIRANFTRSILGLPANVRDNAISRFHCLLGPQGQGENARGTVEETRGQGSVDGGKGDFFQCFIC